MTYRKLKAAGIFTGKEMLDENKVLVCNADGRIEELIPLQEAGEDIETFHGILAPGLINCHCHLELSHLKGLIPEQTGLVDFVFTVVTQRHFPEEEIYDAIAKAENDMRANGIVAVGDICNNALTIPGKEKQNLFYYNFVELSGWLPAVADNRFQRSRTFYEEYLRLPETVSQASMSPHAPYSVSEKLWNLMQPYFPGKTITIHNQETAWEDELFRDGTGDANRMYEMMKIDNGFFLPSGKSSLQTYLGRLAGAKNVMLVHNTFTSEADLIYCSQSGLNSQLFFCLCPNANLYIENRLPPVELLRKYNRKIVIGTDSLASNHGLNILEEIKSIAKNFPGIPLSELLQWSTLQGAEALQLDHMLGSFEKGKRPGIVLLENLEDKKLSAGSTVKRVL